MNFLAKHIQAIGLLMLTGFVAAAAALYLDVPAGVAKPPVAKVAANYSCPMHPEVVSSEPGDCPKCGMALQMTASKTENKPAACQHGDAAGSDASVSGPDGCSHTEEGNAGGCCGKKVQSTDRLLPSGCTRNLQPQTTNSSE